MNTRTLRPLPEGLQLSAGAHRPDSQMCETVRLPRAVAERLLELARNELASATAPDHVIYSSRLVAALREALALTPRLLGEEARP